MTGVQTCALPIFTTMMLPRSINGADAVIETTFGPTDKDSPAFGVVAVIVKSAKAGLALPINSPVTIAITNRFIDPLLRTD